MLMTNKDSHPADAAIVERHFCPHCGRTSRHHVTRDRVPAPVLWCLSCFHVQIEEEPRPVDKPQAA